MARTLGKDASLEHIAVAVGDALRRHGVEAVLTGGACATVFSRGAFQSFDVDYVIQGGASRRIVDAALEELGFARKHDRYVHPHFPYYVEFPRGPLTIGSDHAIEPVEVRLGNMRARSLSATDACRDRLAAFYYWEDRSSLEAAVQIARRNRVDMRKIRAWSEAEGTLDGFETFRREFRRARAR